MKNKIKDDIMLSIKRILVLNFIPNNKTQTSIKTHNSKTFLYLLIQLFF